MPLVEIDAARLAKIAAEVVGMIGKLPPHSMERAAASGLLRCEAEMVGFIIDRYFEMSKRV